jgi:pilus assembly protein Flp/PilA
MGEAGQWATRNKADPTERRGRRKTDQGISPPGNPLRRSVMKGWMQLVKKLYRDERGAALVEYTVLLGVMLVAVIGTIALVGGQLNAKWTALLTALTSN